MFPLFKVVWVSSFRSSASFLLTTAPTIAPDPDLISVNGLPGDACIGDLISCIIVSICIGTAFCDDDEEEEDIVGKTTGEGAPPVVVFATKVEADDVNVTGATAVGVTVTGATAVGVTVTGVTAVGVTVTGVTAVGVTVTGATAVGVTVTGVTAVGVTVTGATAVGVTVTGVTAVGVTATLGAEANVGGEGRMGVVTSAGLSMSMLSSTLLS